MMTVKEPRSTSRSRLRSTCCWLPPWEKVLESLSVRMTTSAGMGSPFGRFHATGAAVTNGRPNYDDSPTTPRRSGAPDGGPPVRGGPCGGGAGPPALSAADDPEGPGRDLRPGAA